MADLNFSTFAHSSIPQQQQPAHITYAGDSDMSQAHLSVGINDYLAAILSPLGARPVPIPDLKFSRTAGKCVSLDQTISGTDFVIVYRPRFRPAPFLIGRVTNNPSTGRPCFGVTSVLGYDDSMSTNWLMYRDVAAGFFLKSEGIPAGSFTLTGRFNSTPIYSVVDLDDFDIDRMASYNPMESIQGVNLLDGVAGLMMPLEDSEYRPVTMDNYRESQDLVQQFNWQNTQAVPGWIADPPAGTQILATLDKGTFTQFVSFTGGFTLRLRATVESLAANSNGIVGYSFEVYYINSSGAYTLVPDIIGQATVTNYNYHAVSNTINNPTSVDTTRTFFTAYPVARIVVRRESLADHPMRSVSVTVTSHGYYHPDNFSTTVVQLEGGSVGQTYGLTATHMYELIPKPGFLNDVTYFSDAVDTVLDYHKALQACKYDPSIRPVYTGPEMHARREYFRKLVQRSNLNAALRAMDFDKIWSWGKSFLSTAKQVAKATQPIWGPALDTRFPGSSVVIGSLLAMDVPSVHSDEKAAAPLDHFGTYVCRDGFTLTLPKLGPIPWGLVDLITSGNKVIKELMRDSVSDLYTTYFTPIEHIPFLEALMLRSLTGEHSAILDDPRYRDPRPDTTPYLAYDADVGDEDDDPIYDYTYPEGGEGSEEEEDEDEEDTVMSEPLPSNACGVLHAMDMPDTKETVAATVNVDAIEFLLAATPGAEQLLSQHMQMHKIPFNKRNNVISEPQFQSKLLNYLSSGTSEFALMLDSFMNTPLTGDLVSIPVLGLMSKSQPIFLAHLAWGTDVAVDELIVPESIYTSYTHLFQLRRGFKPRYIRPVKYSTNSVLRAMDPSSQIMSMEQLSQQLAALTMMVTQLSKATQEKDAEIEILKKAAAEKRTAPASSRGRKATAIERKPFLDVTTLTGVRPLLDNLRAAVVSYNTGPRFYTKKKRGTRFQHFPLIVDLSANHAVMASLVVTTEVTGFRVGDTVNYSQYNRIYQQDEKNPESPAIYLDGRFVNMTPVEVALPKYGAAFLESLRVSYPKNVAFYISVIFQSDDLQLYNNRIEDTSYFYALMNLFAGKPDGLYSTGSVDISSKMATVPGGIDVKRTIKTELPLLVLDPENSLKDGYPHVGQAFEMSNTTFQTNLFPVLRATAMVDTVAYGLYIINAYETEAVLEYADKTGAEPNFMNPAAAVAAVTSNKRLVRSKSAGPAISSTFDPSEPFEFQAKGGNQTTTSEDVFNTILADLNEAGLSLSDILERWASVEAAGFPGHNAGQVMTNLRRLINYKVITSKLTLQPPQTPVKAPVWTFFRTIAVGYPNWRKWVFEGAPVPADMPEVTPGKKAAVPSSRFGLGKRTPPAPVRKAAAAKAPVRPEPPSEEDEEEELGGEEWPDYNPFDPAERKPYDPYSRKVPKKPQTKPKPGAGGSGWGQLMM